MTEEPSLEGQRTAPKYLTDKTQRDGAGGFLVGQLVRTNDDVRPPRFVGRRGVVAEVRHVVPTEIADALHAGGRVTNNGDFEIGVDLSETGVEKELKTDAWFLHGELHPVVVMTERPTASVARHTRRRQAPTTTRGRPGRDEPE